MLTAEEEFWERLDQIEAGMLGLAGDSIKLPMAPSLREEADGRIWFITTQGLAMVTALTLGPSDAEFVVADARSGLYAAVTGELALIDDEDIIEELWSPVTAAWMDDARHDAALRLLRLTPKSGQAWYSTVRGMEFLYDVARAKTSEVPSIPGWTAKLAF